MGIISVSQLNRYVASRLREDQILRAVLVRGEISNFTRNFRSGHCYFSLQDEEASVHAVMFRSNAERLPFEPQNGMHVLLQGAVTLYERDGAFQINVTDMQPDGVGAQALALQQRREKLAKLGFFDPAHKRTLPKFPKKIGIVTSQSGAALHDMLHILERRYPLVTVCLYPALVQGDAAPESIAQSLKQAGADGCDVILMGRGGGSKEDLSAFQSEAVADAVYHSPVPVVSAVGHETDHCIADDVADLRAPTPSAAAELAVPEKQTLLSMLDAAKERLDQAFLDGLEDRAFQLHEQTLRLEKCSPACSLALAEQRLSALGARLRTAMQAQLNTKHQAWELAVSRMEATSPLAVMQRGFALVYQNETIVRDAAQLHTDDRLTVRFARGQAEVQVIRTESGGSYGV
ncbi:MAG: exodeoxyribonuclease VII large subunit [Oscillospiraceae bacterium]|nr:exodeoxyribonuclease VII large subunit [Oscillospiraceae bacterium]